MTFSKETLDSTLSTLTVDVAVQMIGLAGGTRELQTLVAGLARNFNTVVPPNATAAIQQASRRWYAVNRHPMISYHIN